MNKKTGRKPKYKEETAVIGVRLPVAVKEKVPNPKSDWVANLIIKNLPK